MRIALAQVNTTVGDLEGNAAVILRAAREAVATGAEIVALPELVVTGYPPRDLLNNASFVAQTERAVAHIVAELPEGIIAAFGTPRRRPGGGRKLYNGLVAASRGRIVFESAKSLLPTYDVFDEQRYFEPAPPHARRVLELGRERVGFVICEDMWNDRIFWGDSRLYDRDPVAEAIEQGATLLVNLSASPFSQRRHITRRRIIGHAASRWRVPVAYVNAIGGQDGLLFDGGSLACGPNGDVLDALPFFEEAQRVVDLRAPASATMTEPDPMRVLADALTVGVRDYARKTGMKRWTLGLSGGIDSALVAAIGTLALGAENGAAFAMPSRYSSDHSIADARALAEALGLPFSVVPIEPGHVAYETMLGPVLTPLGPEHSGDVTWENVQARVRGALLMAHANRNGSLVLTTGNKSECSVGYSTLYGDMCGGLAVIGDLWKLEVYALSRWLNDNHLNGAIPLSTLTKPPSAELAPGQRDDQSLPPYDVLDPIMRCLVEDEIGAEETAARTGEPLERVQWLERKLFRAEYKRKQFAPTLRVSGRSWTGRDYPIAMGWKG